LKILMMTNKKLIILSIVFFLFSSCANIKNSDPGKIEYSKTEKAKEGEGTVTESWKIVQPENAIEPATIDNGISASTGSSQERSFILEKMQGTTTYIGIILIVFGIASLGLAGYIPFISGFQGLWVSLAGVVVMVVPWFLSNYGGILAIIIAVLGIVTILRDPFDHLINGEKKN